VIKELHLEDNSR